MEEGEPLRLRNNRWGIAIACMMILLAGEVFRTPEVLAEWYVGGYGGYSLPNSLQNVTMNGLGQTLARQQFPQAESGSNVEGRGSLTQSFDTGDLSLKNSPIFGGKVGYFFSQEGLPWLGLELEAFTSKPSIKAQTTNFTQSITFQPNTPDTPDNCALLFPPNPNICPAYVVNKGTLTLQQTSLRVVTVAFNVVARYPGKTFQPYVGVGAGAFYFSATSGDIQGNQWAPGLNAMTGLKVLATEEWGFFVEGKYNLAGITTLDQTFGLSGQYSAYNVLGGIAYHF